jgi:hypothetical protein
MPNSKKYVPGSTCDMTIKQWCEKRNRSLPTFYNLKKKGLAPETIDCIGGPRITHEADAAWEKKMLRLKRQAAAQRKHERRSKQATVAGRLAAKSPLHPANRGHAGRAVNKEPTEPKPRDMAKRNAAPPAGKVKKKEAAE